jgi:hypothetical protein
MILEENESLRPELALRENCMSKLSAVVAISHKPIHGENCH